MEIIRGKIPGAKKVVVYGPEGIGKSTFASRFPEPLFIDTEGSTKELDVARTPAPSSWTMLKEQIRYVISHPEICRTLVVDTIDWAEQLCVEDICTSHQKKGIEDFGYGNGYVYVREEFGRFLNLLNDVVEKGIHVVLTAHAQMRKFEQPDEMGAYDRWEMKLGKKTSSQTSPLVKEWADMLLFANYKTYSVAVDDKGKKHKAQGGKRVMYTQHHPCWDAKNRYGLPDEVDFDYSVIAGIISGSAAPAPTQKTETPAPQAEAPKQAEPAPVKQEGSGQIAMELSMDSMAQAPVAQKPAAPVPPQAAPAPSETSRHELDGRIPKALRDLMEANNVGEWDIQEVVAARGYYPPDTPIWNYDPDYIAGVLVGAWDQVLGMIRQMWEKEDIPFN
ncbi:MAG TPA: ATP-binding protein [Candidatus Eisenbergiella merdavium]|uniref:ATP-binding protein n=1 Tax=Candidatus Eisenbergiella merdavium TaxID=2838551 RepID=A0A9D2SRX0_9FIRM|nr:ATP-binding protein [Candidatus Eisenbergiella merdavium]